MTSTGAPLPLGLCLALAACGGDRIDTSTLELVDAGDPCPVFACPGGEPGTFRACPRPSDPYADAGLPCTGEGPAPGCVDSSLDKPSAHQCKEQEAIEPAPPGMVWVAWDSACGRIDLAKRAAAGETIADSEWLPGPPNRCVPYPDVQPDAGVPSESILGCCLVPIAPTSALCSPSCSTGAPCVPSPSSCS